MTATRLNPEYADKTEFSTLSTAVSKLFAPPSTVDGLTDLNNAPLGFTSVGSNITSNKPSTYGACLTFTSTGNWRFQFFVSTGGAIYSRQNINYAGWTSWKTLHS